MAWLERRRGVWYVAWRNGGRGSRRPSITLDTYGHELERAGRLDRAGVLGRLAGIRGGTANGEGPDAAPPGGSVIDASGEGR